MSTRNETILWIAQRASAAILGVCVLVHLLTIVYVTQAGLRGADIVDRLQGDGLWFAFYFLFSMAIAIHAPIGIRAILLEHTRLHKNMINISVCVLAVALFWFGIRSMLLLFTS